MAASIPRTQVTGGNIVAPFADTTMDDYLALVAAHPDIHYRFNAAGDVIEMAGTYIHSRVQSLISTHFDIWLWTGALPGYRVDHRVPLRFGRMALLSRCGCQP